MKFDRTAKAFILEALVARLEDYEDRLASARETEKFWELGNRAGYLRELIDQVERERHHDEGGEDVIGSASEYSSRLTLNAS